MQDDLLGSRENRSDFDLEAALSYAEMLLTKSNLARSRLWRMRLSQLALAFTFIYAGIIAITSLFYDHEGLAEFLVSAIGTAIGVLVLSLLFLIAREAQFTTRERLREVQAMIEIVGIVRELLPSIADRERWSEPRRLLMHARLARFSISYKSYDD